MRHLVPILLLAFCCLCALLAQGTADEDLKDKLDDSLREMGDGHAKRIVVDGDGMRVEEMPWYERAWKWLKSLFCGDQNDDDRKSRRRRRAAALARAHNASTEDGGLITVDAKIVFFKNGTRVVDIHKGPLITVDPNGAMRVDYRNGTVKRIDAAGGGSRERQRQRRFTSIDDLYMAHGWQSQIGRDVGEFGKEGVKDWERAKMRADSDEEEAEGGAYWDRPLYGQSKEPAANEWDAAQGAEQQEQDWQPKQSSSIGQPGGRGGAGRRMPGVQQDNGPALSSAGRAPSVRPPAVSPPLSWSDDAAPTAVDEEQQKPLTPEELALARKVLKRLEEQRLGGKRANSGGQGGLGSGGRAQQKQGEGSSTGGGGQISAKKVQDSVQDLPQAPPKWAQPKN